MCDGRGKGRENRLKRQDQCQAPTQRTQRTPNCDIRASAADVTSVRSYATQFHSEMVLNDGQTLKFEAMVTSKQSR
jgi:hypothetical protein